MNDIERIDINVMRIGRPIFLTINPKEFKAYGSNGEKDISIDTIERLLSIVCLWDDEYLNNKIDAPEYRVQITTIKETVEYKGIGNYPDNYKEFLNLVGKING